MGRLIDTDAITDFMLEHNIPDSLFASVEEIVAYQPTAFDVKTVILTLMGHSQSLCNAIKCSEKCDICMVHRFIQEQLEIVRKGGVNHG